MQAEIVLPGRDQTEMHGSGARAIEKYNPETMERHRKGAGAMQRLHCRRKPSYAARLGAAVSIDPAAEQKLPRSCARAQS
jgi:hypothetical protein